MVCILDYNIMRPYSLEFKIHFFSYIGVYSNVSWLRIAEIQGEGKFTLRSFPILY